MKRAMLVPLLFSFGCLVFAAQPAAPKGWEFLSRSDIGAQAFTDAHPQWDGRGVLIAVCDSGVELGTPGLLTTSDGKPKILDARVFCSEGKISLEKAETSKDEHGTALHGKDGKWLYGLDKAAVKPAPGEDAYVGYFKESDFKNSDANGGDFNNNGTADDVYGLVVFKSGKTWTALLDTNADGSLADETPLADFSESRQAFHLRGRDLHEKPNLMTFALNLWMDGDEKKAALYMADGPHGTHVSGICAGFEIDGQHGFNGIAPGAQILALKIGSNVLSGGSTTEGSMVSAWRYAVKKAKELGMPLVIQMSYGIGSEQEGKAVAEKLLDELLEENPGVVAAVSAGNEGPGLSTVGLPACGKSILAIGAVMNKTSAKDLLGVNLTQDEMFSFSDRGGEMAKPEVVCPGFASSTVPVYSEGHDVMRGTSMASPQASGALALVYSAALASKAPLRGDAARAALMRGAVPIPGYGPADQGHGLVNVPRAWTVYQALAARSASQPVIYQAETESPEMAGHKGPAIFWRGDFFPEGSATQTVTIKPEFPREASGDDKAHYYQAFDVTVDAPWVTVEKDASYMKAEEPARLPVRFNAKALAKPGCYQATIKGYAKDMGAGERERLGPEWTVPVVVAVPERFDNGDHFKIRRDISGLKPAKLERIFFLVDSQVSGVTAEVRLTPGEKNSVVAYLFDPRGRNPHTGLVRPGHEISTLNLGSTGLEPGVWELDLYANPANTSAASAKVELQAFPLCRVLPEKVPAKLSQGQSPAAVLTIVSSLPAAFRGSGKGSVTGNVTEKTHKLNAAQWSRTFTVAPGESGVTFDLSMSPEDYNTFTDIPVQILDAGGKALLSEGMSYRKGSYEFEPPKGAKADAKYTLKVSGATADPENDAPAWTLHVKEIHAYAQPVPLTVKDGKEDRIVLYPEHSQDLALTLKGVPPALPEGAAWLAEAALSDAETPGLTLPIEIQLAPGK